MNSITRHWLRGSLLVTVLVCLVAEGVFVYAVTSSFYGGTRRAMDARIATVLTQLDASGAATGEARSVLLRRMVEQFAEKDRFELMLVNASGAPVVTSAGYTAETSAGRDYRQAAQGGGTGSAVYRTAMDEKVMAVTTMLPRAAGGITAVRLVTSLTLVDRSMLTLILASLVVVCAVILFSVWTGLFFIRSIVRPIGQIEITAAEIAQGNLDTRIDNRYEGEIGKLCDAINHMAVELSRTERMKNDFISSVSHELRTPLTSIKGWIETIGSMSADEPNFRRGVQIIASETDRLYGMVEELLDFSRMQRGLKLSLQRLDLVAEVSDAVLMAQQRVGLEDLLLAYEEPEAPVPVLGDPARLRQVFVNLLDNAVKYSPPQGAITVTVGVRDGMACAAIRDEGPGIAPDELENVKVKFYKGRGAARGSGIGLAVADEIMTAHGGSLALESELGHGTTAVIRLPLASGDQNSEETKGMHD